MPCVQEEAAGAMQFSDQVWIKEEVIEDMERIESTASVIKTEIDDIANVQEETSGAMVISDQFWIKVEELNDRIKQISEKHTDVLEEELEVQRERKRLRKGTDSDAVDKFAGKECHTTAGANCEYCFIKLVDEKWLKEHKKVCKVKHDMEMMRMAGTGERRHVCLDCGKGFKTKYKLEKHQPVHTKARAYVCDSCGNNYSTREGLAAHIKDKHMGIKYQCGECDKQFGKKCNLTSHIQQVHKKEKKFKCPKCGIAFPRKLSLSTHIATVHDKIKNYTCEYCSMSFGRKETRKAHIENIHLNIRYPCTWPDCVHEARTQEALRNHSKRVHTGEWNLECQLCMDQLGKWWGCLYPVEMDNHRAKKHKVEWEEEQEAYKRDHPFICQVDRCDNRFSTEVEVERHQNQMH